MARSIPHDGACDKHRTIVYATIFLDETIARMNIVHARNL
jgi:hypothetical protein